MAGRGSLKSGRPSGALGTLSLSGWRAGLALRTWPGPHSSLRGGPQTEGCRPRAALAAHLAWLPGWGPGSPVPPPQLLARDLRGEMTLPVVDEPQPPLCGSSLRLGVAQFLSLSQESDAVRDALTPSLACAAARAGDLEALQALAALGTDLSLEDFTGQTPLHAAARGGHAGVVAALLQKGANVDARDEDGLSPLLLAIKGRHRSVIGLLRAAGARLSPQELEEAGTELCRLATKADREGLRAWWQAGADLGRPGYDGRSALLVAEAAGHLEVVTLLRHLQGGADGLAPEGPPGRADHTSEELVALQLDPGLGAVSKGQA